MKTEQQHILAHLKFLDMFTVLLVRFGLHSSMFYLQSPHIYYGDRSILLYNYTGFSSLLL